MLVALLIAGVVFMLIAVFCGAKRDEFKEMEYELHLRHLDRWNQ